MGSEHCQSENAFRPHNRVSVHPYEEYHSKYGSCRPVREFEIAGKGDISLIRREVDRFFADRLAFWSEVRLPILITLSEAVTNVVKFTPGGKLMIFAGEAGPCFHIIDHGGGLDLDVLLCIISGKRFSTCSSLGMGFPIMVRFAEEVTVYTSEQGTILVLQFDLDRIVKENTAV